MKTRKKRKYLTKLGLIVSKTPSTRKRMKREVNRDKVYWNKSFNLLQVFSIYFEAKERTSWRRGGS